MSGRGHLRFPVLLGLVLRPLVREKLRTLLTVAGISVGVGVLVAIQLANSSALRAFSESVDAVAGRANFQVVADAGTLDQEVLLRLQPLWARGVRFAPVIDVDAVMMPRQTPIRILAVDLLSDLHFRDYRYARVATAKESARTDRDAGPRDIASFLELFRPDSAVVPEVLASQYGLTIGSSLPIEVEGRRVNLVVRGILQPIGPATAFNGSLAIVDISVAQRTLGFEGKLSRIDLLVPEREVTTVGAALQRTLPEGTRVERPSRRSERVGKMLRAFRVNLFALAGVSLLVGIFLVYNTVLISVLRRRRDVGVFKTLGVSPRQIFTSFLLEGVSFGVLGSIIGLTLGYGLALGTLDLIARTINALYVNTSPTEITITPGVAAVAIAIGVGVSVFAAIQPAIEAASTRPSALIRPGLYQRIATRRATTLLVVAGVLLAAAAAAALLPAVDSIPVGGYLSVTLVIIGFSLLAPSILSAISRMSRRPFTAMFGMSGRMAAATMPASLRRTSIATAALSIAIGMMVAIAIMVGSFRETVRTWVGQTVQSDLWLRPARGLSNASVAVFPETITEDLRKVDFIAAFDRVRGRRILFRDSLIDVAGADMDVSEVYGDLPMITPRSSRAAMRAAVQRDGVMISESMSVKFDLSVSDVITLPTAHGARRFPITGIHRDYSNDRGVVVMSRDLYIRSFDDRAINTIAIFLKPGVDPEKARLELEHLLGARYHAFAFTNRSIRTEVMRIFDQTFLITYALLALALIVAVLGIVNTLSALILERRREIALLRILGTLQSEVRTMLVLESAIVGIAATALGSVVGYVLSWILIFVINKQSFGWTIQMNPPIALLIVSVSVTFVATLVAGLLPARLAERIAIAEELKAE